MVPYFCSDPYCCILNGVQSGLVPIAFTITLTGGVCLRYVVCLSARCFGVWGKNGLRDIPLQRRVTADLQMAVLIPEPRFHGSSVVASGRGWEEMRLQGEASTRAGVVLVTAVLWEQGAQS